MNKKQIEQEIKANNELLALNIEALQKELDLSFENLAPQQLGLDLF